MDREPIWENEDPNIDHEKDYWDEYDWERFMAQQDRKVEQLVRMDKLFRGSGMDSRDHELLAGEEVAGRTIGCDGNCPECEERFSCDTYQERLREESLEATGDLSAEPYDFLEDARQIPACRECSDFAVATMQWFEAIPDEMWENEPAVDKLAENCGLPGAKIAGGAGFGYSPMSIGGNIANCKRAAAAMQRCIEALEVLSNIPETADRASELKPRAEKCLPMIHDRIQRLRAQARVVWGQTG